MSPAQALSKVGLIKPSRRRGFCPACRIFQTDDGPQEIAAPALIALAFLIIAVIAWVWTVMRMNSMNSLSPTDSMSSMSSVNGMTTGLGSFGPFFVTWTVMMAAMMLPTAMPLVFEFAQHAERRRGWRTATALLGATYLSVWVAFGVVGFMLYDAIGMPWPHQQLIGGGVLVIAGLYALTPLKRASEALCRERCALHGPLPFNLKRSAVVAGARFGLSCLGCTAGLMAAMVLVGMTSLVWTIVIAAAVLVYKLAPAPTPRLVAASSGALVALGVLYAVAG